VGGEVVVAGVLARSPAFSDYRTRRRGGERERERETIKVSTIIKRQYKNRKVKGKIITMADKYGLL